MKIYIPTVKRVDQQITYNNLSKELQKDVVFVVQAWERDQYKYDNEYLVLPDHITLDHPRPLAETRKVIYEQAKNTKYAMIDDDITFYRRNQKYWTGESNMEKSNRVCTPDDLLEMFEMFDSWLDEPTVSLASCWPVPRFPSKKIYENNKLICSVFFINGNDFKDELPKWDLTCVKIAQDVILNLYLLSNGFGNRLSNEFIFKNISENSTPKKDKIKSEIWEVQKKETNLQDHLTIERMFPDFFKVLFDETGNRVSGGYNGIGKVRVMCKKAYAYSKTKNIMEFV